MNSQVTMAESALKEGRRDAAIDAYCAALTSEPELAADVYLALGRQLYFAARFAEGEAWTGRAVARYAASYELWNVRGAILRSLQRHEDALAAFDRAIALRPDEAGAQVNRGNTLLDLKDLAGAEAAFARVAAQEPEVAAHRVNHGRALAQLGRGVEAATRFREATVLKPDLLDAWTFLAELCDREGDPSRAEATFAQAIRANRERPPLPGALITLLRSGGKARRAEAVLQSLLPEFEDQAWLHVQLGELLTERDREASVRHLRRAVELDPNIHHRALLAQALLQVRGDAEGQCLEEAYRLARGALEGGGLNSAHLMIFNRVFHSACALDDAERLGDFATLGRACAAGGQPSALLEQLPAVRTPADRLELLEQHRIWARSVEAVAAARPIRRPDPRPRDGRIRLGLMSSDLRDHPVGYFALPLFEHRDAGRFDLFCYSFFPGEEDRAQSHFAGRATAFRRMSDATVREAAQTIAEDRLDVLIELGGSTAMNRPEVMAYRPAPIQASWLGYPHSTGLAAIDHIICDPFTKPSNPALMSETALLLPNSWVAFSPAAFTGCPAVEPSPPQDRTGSITFGTANNPYKYNRAAISAWARTVAAVPNSRFMIVRPEAGSETFRRNLEQMFAAEGVDPSRLVFRAVRGGQMEHYNEIDISLDTFPLTGGTTTVEALWMGMPVVSMKGEAFYERLSYSILSNVGLADLVADDVEGFVRIAAQLAADRPRRAALRSTLREQMARSPLGQAETFARDFYEMIAARVGAV
jgi:predicted O-linked N-acetylglucosamine transferase (SPINDLY family)